MTESEMALVEAALERSARVYRAEALNEATDIAEHVLRRGGTIEDLCIALIERFCGAVDAVVELTGREAA